MSDIISRPIIDNQYIEIVLLDIKSKIEEKLNKHGHHTFISRHEILGIIMEEVDELVSSVRLGSDKRVMDELSDIAVGAIFGIVAIKQDAVHW